MKLLMVFFPNPNAGDYLIKDRTIRLFRNNNSDDEIIVLDGLVNPNAQLDYNSFDAIIFGGGPFFDDRVMENLIIPFFDKINTITVPIHIVGSGVYGDDCSDYGVFERSFSNETMRFYNHIQEVGGTFGCRDEISYYIMKNAGFDNSFMTGCPAWYDLDYIDNLSLRYNGKIDKIIVSNPGLTKKMEEQEIRAQQCIEIVGFIRDFFPNAELVFTFNAGISTKYSSTCNNIIRRFLDDKKIRYIDMSGDYRGFDECDTCDIHIGFRVHSHVYCLSHGIPSILIEEDLRGYGMNEALGLPHMLSYDSHSMHMNHSYNPNPFLLDHLKSRLLYELNTGFFRYYGAFETIRNMYRKMWNVWIKAVMGSDL